MTIITQPPQCSARHALDSTRSIAPDPRRRVRQPAAVRRARVALLGCGVVGSAVARAILESSDCIERSSGIRLHLSRILVRDKTRDREFHPALFTSDFADVLNDKPDLIVELMGGSEPAREYASLALRRRIPIVTANKSLMARHGESLRAIAASHGSAIAHEASVGGAVPVIATLRQLAGDRVRSIRGIINGTCNYILSRMAAGFPFDDALRQAISLGLAEPNPEADISGQDATEKLCVLAAETGWRGVGPDQVAVERIDRVTSRDIGLARQHRCVIKQIAELHTNDHHQFSLQVGPAWVKRDHPLARVDGEDNAVLIESERAGPLFLQGRGAGPRPTASAVLGDMLRLLCAQKATSLTIEPQRRRRDMPESPDRSAWMLRRHFARVTCDAENLNPERVFAALHKHRVAALHMEFEPNDVAILTEPLDKQQLFSAIKSLIGESDAHGLIMPVIE